MQAVKQQLPPFNDYLLKTFRKDQINRSVEYVDTVFREAIKLFNGEIIYHGCDILSPEHRLDELNDPAFKRGFNIQISELQLVRFTFLYEGNRIVTHMYLPYIKDGAITIDDTKYYLQLAIIEKVIYRIADGIIVKVMRSPLHFWRSEQFGYVNTKGKSFIESIITTKIHYKQRKRAKRDIKTALLLYPLSHFGLLGTYQHFNIDPSTIQFVDSENLTAPEDIMYIKVREGIYVKVKPELMQGDYSRIVASLVYCLRYYKEATIPDIYDPSGVIWKIILGKSIYGLSTKSTLAHNHAEKHFTSLATYLDPLTQAELAKQNIFCNDIYDLLITVFKSIDGWIANYKPNNLYDKKLGVLELIMSELVETIFKKMYGNPNDQKLTLKTVRAILRMPSKKIAGLYKCGAVRGSTQIYGDNELLTIQGKKIRQPISQETPGKQRSSKKKAGGNIIGSDEHQFDTSALVHESILSIPSSNPGDGGDINPYAPISHDGSLLKPDYASDLEELESYLPSRGR